MANFKHACVIITSLLLIGCFNHEENQFFLDLDPDGSKRFHYRDIHTMSLTLSKLETSVNETGFNPILTGRFTLENTQKSPFHSAWVAFTINLLIADKTVATFQKAGVLKQHKINVEFQHNLPSFGIKPEQIKIDITPVAWMPSYPLSISQ